MLTINHLKDETKARTRRRRTHAREAAEAQTSRAPRNDLLPKLQVVDWPLDKLTVPDRYVRKLLPAQIERVVTSFKTYGVIQPILIKSDGELIDGRTRMEAARRLGLATLPAICIDHLSEAEVRALRIALGRIPELGEWDLDALRLEFEDLLTLDGPIDATGFSLPEIEALTIAEIDEPALDEVPPVDHERTVSRTGDSWRLGLHRIVCGDALKPETYKALLGDEKVRLVLTDTPYNVPIQGHVTSGDHREFAMASGEMSTEQFGEFIAAWVQACNKVLVPGGLLATFIDWRSVQLVLNEAGAVDLDLLNIVVWAKTNGGMGSLWRSQHELLPVFKKPGGDHINNVQLGKHGRYRSNVWQYPGASSLGSDARDGLADHPTVKPVALLEDALLDITNRDDLVLEPFAGSGSTLIACQTTGRRCRALEIDPAYVDVVVRRWQATTGKPAICEETGMTFDEVAAERAADARKDLPVVSTENITNTDINLERGGA